MPQLKVQTIDTAPDSAKALLTGAKNKVGFVPNLYGVMSHSPATLEAYFKLSEQVGKTSLSAEQQQVAYLSVSYVNGCDYCVAAHSGIAKGAGVPDEVIEALRNGNPLNDSKLEALRRFTVAMVEKRGWVSETDIDAFMQSGYKEQNILEVVLVVAMKTISNYTNHIAQTPLDKQFAPHKWQKPDQNAA